MTKAIHFPNIMKFCASLILFLVAPCAFGQHVRSRLPQKGMRRKMKGKLTRGSKKMKIMGSKEPLRDDTDSVMKPTKKSVKKRRMKKMKKDQRDMKVMKKGKVKKIWLANFTKI